MLTVLPIIDKVLERAAPLYSAAPTNKTPHINAYHYCANKVRFPSGDTYVAVVVREDAAGTFYYDNDATSVEEIERASSPPPAYFVPNKERSGGAKPLKGRSAEWWGAVKGGVARSALDAPPAGVASEPTAPGQTGADGAQPTDPTARGEQLGATIPETPATLKQAKTARYEVWAAESRSEEVAVRWRAVAGPSSGARPSVGKLTEIVEERLAGFADQPPVHIVDTAADVDPRFAGENIGGVTFRRRIYLLRAGFKDDATAVRTLWHELLHYGVGSSDTHIVRII